MEITIVYVTYANDLPWLAYSLRSVQKFVTGFNKIVLYCHDVCCGDLYAIVRNLDLPCRIIPVSYDYHGYLKQMVVKAECYNDISSEYIAIIDSDNIFNCHLNMRNLLLPDGKIQWFYHTSPIPSEVTVWKNSYESMTKTIQDKYYMSNGFPFIFTNTSMRMASEHFKHLHGVDYSTFCKKGCRKFNIRVEEGIRSRFLDMAQIFEEFEWLGFYCHAHSSDYVFTPHTERKAPSPLIQYWSHGGITPEIKTIIEDILQ